MVLNLYLSRVLKISIINLSLVLLFSGFCSAQSIPIVDKSSYQLDELHRELGNFFPLEVRLALVPVHTAIYGDECIVEIPGLSPVFGTVRVQKDGIRIYDIALSAKISCSIIIGREIECKSSEGKFLMSLKSISRGGGEMPTFIRDVISSLAEYHGQFPDEKLLEFILGLY